MTAAEETGPVAYTVYLASTGEVLRTGMCSLPEDVSRQATSRRERVLQQRADGETQYVDTATGALAPRPSIAVPDCDAPLDGERHVVATGLPAGTAIYSVADGLETLLGKTRDGEVQIDATEPGTLSLMAVPPFPYRPAHWLVRIA